MYLPNFVTSRLKISVTSAFLLQRKLISYLQNATSLNIYIFFCWFTKIKNPNVVAKVFHMSVIFVLGHPDRFHFNFIKVKVK